MSREIQQDFTLLKMFLKEYQLSNLLENTSFNTVISQQHKKYFSYLTFMSEIQNFIDNKNFKDIISSAQIPFLKESCSDTATSFFSTFHGGYKSSKLLLRSSIETFLKGFFLDQITDLDREPSVYDLFRKVKTLPFYSTEPNKLLIDRLHNIYKELCKDVHTASNLNMVNLSALNYFPTFNKSQADEVSKFNSSLISSYLTLLCIKYNGQYHSFHYKNKENIIESIPKEYRQKVNNVSE